MSARVVLSCWGSYGDLFPYLSVAARLGALGHRPVVATSEFYRDLVLGQGVDFHPVRPDIDPGDTGLLARAMDPARGSEVVIRELVVPAIRDAFDDLSDAVRGADLLVTHPITFAGPLVAEKQRLPWLSTVLAPISMFSAYDFPILPQHSAVTRVARWSPVSARVVLALIRAATARWMAPVRAFRRELGLPNDKSPLFAGQFSPHGTLAMFSSVLGAPQPDWPPRTIVTGFAFHEDHAPLPADVAAFLDAGDPPIVFTLGTSAVGAAGAFYDESVKAAEAIGRRAVLLVGRDPRNRPSRALPPTMLAAEYAPHGALFERAAAVVHHGGIGTMARALRAMTPSLVVPHSHDQFDNAARVRALGVARVRDARHYRCGEVAADLRALLADRVYATRAAEVGRLVQSESGAVACCETIARVANGQQA